MPAGEARVTRITLLKDDPRGAAGADDLLGHEAALETLLTAVRSLRPPACVALYGSWGSGKTTLLRRAQREWTRPPEGGGTPGRAVWFDPWEYEGQDDLLIPLMAALMRAVGEERRVDPARAKRLIEGAAKVTLALAVRFGTAFAFGGLGGEVLGQLAPLAGLAPEKLAELFGEKEGLRDEVERVKGEFAGLVRTLQEDRPGPLVFFLDDLDRCLPDSTVALIEGVKLLMCSETDCPVVFVFALDRQIVGEAIRQRYPGSSAYTGENYLEKIFDLSLEVPSVDEAAVEEFITSRLETRDEGIGWIHEALCPPHGTGDGADLDGDGHEPPPSGLCVVRDVLCEPCFANPRVIQRTMNRLILLLADAERRDRIRTVGDRTVYEHLVTWVAGAERFRGFRRLFQSASEIEIVSLHQVASSYGTSTRTDSTVAIAQQPHIASLISQPGFLGYYELLGLGVLVEDQVLAERLSSGDLSTYRDIDDLLISAGL